MMLESKVAMKLPMVVTVNTTHLYSVLDFTKSSLSKQIDYILKSQKEAADFIHSLFSFFLLTYHAENLESHARFKTAIYPPTGAIEIEEEWSVCPGKRAVLCVKTFQPGLAEEEVCWAQEGYRVMILGHIDIRCSDNLFHLVYGCCR